MACGKLQFTLIALRCKVIRGDGQTSTVVAVPSRPTRRQILIQLGRTLQIHRPPLTRDDSLPYLLRRFACLAL